MNTTQVFCTSIIHASPDCTVDCFYAYCLLLLLAAMEYTMTHLQDVHSSSRTLYSLNIIIALSPLLTI